MAIKTSDASAPSAWAERLHLNAAESDSDPASRWVRGFDTLDATHLASVGGKNASLGEMVQHLSAAGVRVPPGFATTAEAYRRFLEVNELESEIKSRLDVWRAGSRPLAEVGAEIRGLIVQGHWPTAIAGAIREAYGELGRGLAEDPDSLPVAVRSSATAEDLPEASFAGQLESFLHVVGPDALLEACRCCFALYRPRLRLSPRARLRRHGRRAVGGRPEDGAFRPRVRGRPVHARHRDRLPRNDSDPVVVGPRREHCPGDRRSGRVQGLQDSPRRGGSGADPRAPTRPQGGPGRLRPPRRDAHGRDESPGT